MEISAVVMEPLAEGVQLRRRSHGDGDDYDDAAKGGLLTSGEG